jgi:hypothetical protein
VSAATPPVHQALHGYRDGHRLLASSTSIDELDQRQMLVLSDSADARQIPPDAPLLSGYPLPSGGHYVLALTWPALEVRRPGCVWTHSLLIPDPLLAKPDLLSLLDAFSRPRLEGEDWGPYAEALDSPLLADARSPAASLQRAPAVTETLLWSLYEPPAPPIDLRSSALKGIDQHRFLLAIWLQQPPALRASFAFAQAPRTARRLGERLFDLQLTGSPQQGSWEEPTDRPPPRTITKPLERQPPNWCAALRADLKSPAALREFLRDFSRDELASREGMWALASVFAALDPAYRSDLASGLRALARICPGPSEAADLKRALFSSKPDPRLPFPVDQIELLLALASSELGEEAEADGLGDRLTELLKVDEPLVIRLTGELLGRRSKAAGAGLEAIGAALTNAQVKRWAAEDEELLALLAVHSQPLLSRPVLLSSLDFETAWPILGKPHMARGKRLALLQAALEGGAAQFPAAAIASWPDGLELLLEAIHSTGSEADLSGPLEDAKARPVVSWLNANGPSPAVASALLDAWSAKKLEKVPLAEWDHLLESGGTLSDFTLVLLFLAATDPETGFGPQTAVRAYDELYLRLRSASKMKPKALQRLGRAARDTKASPPKQAGDLLASGFAGGNWPAKHLLLIEKPAALRQVLSSPHAAPLIASLIPILDSSGASKEQGDVVWKALFASQDVSFVEKALTPVREAILWPSRLLRR